jgi:hypothetical protein
VPPSKHMTDYLARKKRNAERKEAPPSPIRPRPRPFDVNRQEKGRSYSSANYGALKLFWRYCRMVHAANMRPIPAMG